MERGRGRPWRGALRERAGLTAVGFYATYVLPRLIDLAMRRADTTEERRKLVPLATGTVLEVGIGSGLNAPLLTAGVERLYAIDPSRALWRLAEPRVRGRPFRVVFVAASAVAIPLEAAAVDTVLMTWTLCSIPDPRAALAEIRRVLRPDGRLIFIEHGRAPEARVQRWQDRLNTPWGWLAGGCNLNRPVDTLIAGAGFRMTHLDRGYGEGPKPFVYLYRGIAEPAPR